MPHIIFRQIAECRSLTQIDYLIWCAGVGEELSGLSQEELNAVVAIKGSNDLDEIHLICADILGDDEHAAALRAWLVKKAARGKK